MTKGFLPASGLTSASSVNIFVDGAAISQGQIRTSSEPDRRLKGFRPTGSYPLTLDTRPFFFPVAGGDDPGDEVALK